MTDDKRTEEKHLRNHSKCGLDLPIQSQRCNDDSLRTNLMKMVIV